MTLNELINKISILSKNEREFLISKEALPDYKRILKIVFEVKKKISFKSLEYFA